VCIMPRLCCCFMHFNFFMSYFVVYWSIYSSTEHRRKAFVSSCIFEDKSNSGSTVTLLQNITLTDEKHAFNSLEVNLILYYILILISDLTKWFVSI
jgi:hypothetical protein